MLATGQFIDRLSQIAVIQESEGKGPFCSLVMAVVVLKDVMVFLAFAANLETVSVVRTLLHSINISRARHALHLNYCIP
jgi:hypothetical protein